MQIKKVQIDYKWVILITCFLMEFVCLGLCSSNPGLYMAAVVEALGIKRSAFSFGTSIRYITQVITALYFGTMIQRFGIRKMACVGLASLVGSLFVRSAATNIVQYYLGCVLWGLGIVFSGGTMASTIVRRWFHKDIGKYTGIVMSANGIGGAIGAQIISPIINNGETFGYRKAYILSGIIALSISIFILLCLKENAEKENDGSGNQKKKPRGAAWVGIPYSETRKKAYFYLTAALVFLTGISLQSIGSVSIMNMRDVGLSEEFIATTATVSSLMLTVAKFMVGYIYDKKGLKFTLMMCELAAALSFMLKASLTNSTQGMVFAMTAVVLGSVAMPLETVMIPLLSNDLFGSASYTKVLGVFMAMNSLGLCLGSPLGDIYYDFFGTYAPCFWFFCGLMVVIIIAFRRVISMAEKDKEAILAKEE